MTHPSTKKASLFLTIMIIKAMGSVTTNHNAGSIDEEKMVKVTLFII
jgi:hypothetical protein